MKEKQGIGMKLLTANFLIMLTLLCKLECDTLTCFKVETTALVKEVIFFIEFHEHPLKNQQQRSV